MASIAASGTGDLFWQSSKVLEAAKIVEIDISSVDDADTYAAGPGLLAPAWNPSSTTNTSEVSVAITARATGTVTFSMGANGKAGTLLLFYGKA